MEKKKKEKTNKEKKRLNINKIINIIIAIVLLCETSVLLFFVFSLNGKRGKIRGQEWAYSYTYSKEKYKVSFKFNRGNKFEYGVYKDNKLEEDTRLEGKYFLVDNKIVVEYKEGEDLISSVIYIGKDYLCMSYKDCDESTRYYNIKDKRALEYKPYGGTTVDEDEDTDEDTSYLENKPEYKKVSEPTIYIFHGDGCPHCADLLDWIKDFKYKKSYKIVKYEVWKNQDNSKLMNKVGKYLDADAGGVPFIVIGDETITGFSESSTPAEITKALDNAYSKIEKNKYYDVIETVKK